MRGFSDGAGNGTTGPRGGPGPFEALQRHKPSPVGLHDMAGGVGFGASFSGGGGYGEGRSGSGGGGAGGFSSSSRSIGNSHERMGGGGGEATDDFIPMQTSSKRPRPDQRHHHILDEGVIDSMQRVSMEIESSAGSAGDAGGAGAAGGSGGMRPG